ncbi:TetR/AcrR family transcriptional regulator [Nocardioides sp. TRM66260-LWL]|uniref:TetR/AcrR family transcriptional regulator n=1 Tax=Nocardioides sp. TRM66260-LWL TaxID=2874478 RepID=UPI001CC81C84|nr:TetR/AcrR family transcriptional regulator [Nocardioides sp. TRM66260-LWL]MBZ5734758.1 TetR/AcrR family transcriptional regulator [Nocardioides sp. TRM66260-LWL]
MSQSSEPGAVAPVAWREYDAPALPRVLQAALAAFVEHGYHGTSVRDLARASGLSVPGLYHHHPSKQAILVELMEATMAELLARSRAALAEAGDDPEARFDLVVESLLRFHMARRAQAFVGSSELRSLEPDARARIVALRDEQQAMVREAIETCVAAGRFATPHAGDVARAISTLAIGVAGWYREDGPQAADEVVRRQLGLARAMVLPASDR